MYKYVLFCWLCFLFFAFSALPASGQDDELQGTEAEIQDMVVTGTRVPTEIEMVPGRAEIIDIKDLEEMPFTRLDQVLGQISGVQTDSTAGIYERGPRVTMRGLGGDAPARTLVLIDGMPASIGDSGNFRWNRINQADIERIEVFKGPGSSIYGSNAMGGVINIITRKPEKPLVADFTAGYGSYNTTQGSARLGFSQEGTQGFFGQIAATALKSDGYTALTKEHSDYDARKDRFAEEYVVDTKLGYDFNQENSIQLVYSYYDDSRGEGYKYHRDDGAHREYDTDNLRLSYEGAAADWQWYLNGFYQKEDYQRHRDTSNKDDLFVVDSDRKDYGANASVSRDLKGISTVTLGADLRTSSVDAIDDYDYTDDYAQNEGQLDQYAIYLQNELRLLEERLVLLAGLRYDTAEFKDGAYESNIPPFDDLSEEFEDNTWNALSPRLSARYHFTGDISAYASYSRGFRAPILDSLCRHGVFHGRFFDANPELENETLDSFEVGADAALFRDLDLSLSSYYSRGQDFIYSVDTGQERFIWGRDRAVHIMDNVTEVQILGLETDLKYQLSDRLQLFANYTYNRSTIEDFDERPELEGKRLEFVPEHSASAGSRLLHPVLNAQLVLNYVGSQYTDDMNTDKISSYETVDLKLWRKLDFWNPRLTASLEVQNLFDERFMRSEDTRSPGMFVLGELSYEW